MNKKITVKDIAVEITDENELFFSITNTRGMIQLVNNTFCQIAGYSIEELKGAPHNIVRHPDMPKILFHLMWETIKTGEPFGCYIKNLTSDGRYYWVYAFIIPVEDLYLSIRICPRVQNIQSIERLYQRLSNIEKNSFSDAEKELNHWLLARDFISYHSWASSCLAAEIDANISISSRAFSDRLERLSLKPSTRTDLIANHTLNQVFKGYRFMHRNIIDWLRRVDQSIEMLCEFQATLMVLNRELNKKVRIINLRNKINLQYEDNSILMVNFRSNLRFLFDILKKNQFHHSSVLLHICSMNTFISQFFEYLKSESTTNIPHIIDAIESMKTITKSLLFFPKFFMDDKNTISEQIKSHFLCIDEILQKCHENSITLENIQELVNESKEKGNALLHHYENFDPQKLSEAANFYKILSGGELVLEGVSNYAG